MIGPKGSKKKEIEHSCNVSISFPPRGEQGNVSKLIDKFDEGLLVIRHDLFVDVCKKIF